MEKQMTEREKEIVTELNHELYTVEYLEHWLNRNDSIALNPSAALQAMGAQGFYEAVNRMAAGSSHTAEWIPCSERMPENNHSVLVYLESRTIRGGHIHSIGGYQNDVWFIRSGVETESYPNHEWNVIAWMPLPEPYKEAGA